MKAHLSISKGSLLNSGSSETSEEGVKSSPMITTSLTLQSSQGIRRIGIYIAAMSSAAARKADETIA